MNRHQIEFYGDPCRSCGYRWGQPDGDLAAEVLTLESTYRSLLGPLPGTAQHPELDWCASAYVLHVADNLRMHGERMAAGSRGVAFEFVGADQDELARVRGYASVPIEGALWSLGAIAEPYVGIFREAASSGVVLSHPVRGDQLASEVLRGNVHDAHHHGWDLGRIADANRP